MEFKKKTIIWEDNNEPPKDYIWAKKDGKFYEYNYVTRSWVESKSISGGSGGSGSGDLGKQIAEAFVNNAFKTNNEPIPSNLVYPDFIANVQYLDTETEVTIIDSISALVELLYANGNLECLYIEKPFETSPYTITGNESKVFLISGESFYPTDFYGLEFRVDVNEVETNGETFYSITEHLEEFPGQII